MVTRKRLGLAVIALAVTIEGQGCSGGFKSMTSASSSSTSQAYYAPTCTAVAPQRAPMRLLSADEYDNIAADIFGVRTKVSTAAGFDPLAPGASGFSNTGVTSDAGAPAINDLMVEKYWTAAGLVADNVITNKAQAGSAYSKLAACTIGAATVSETCLDSIVRDLALKTWRRPIGEKGTTSEFTRLKAILKGNSTFDVGFNALIKAVLISPNFLSVSYNPSASATASTAFELDDYQLASRLSFFLWQSAPDDELLNLAKSGTLSNQENLRPQVERMLKDAKAKRFALAMTNQWLGVNKILDMGITSPPAATLNAMIMETQLLFEDIISSDVSFLNSINADYSFLNKALADHYGVTFAGTTPTQFYKTNLAATARRGAINHGSFLMLTAGSPTATHPVLRGKTMAAKIGCIEVSPPPATLDTTPPQNLPANSTPTEMLAIHTQRAQCAGCHNILDPYGLPMESFNSVGQWRTSYAELNNRMIDASGRLPSGESFSTTQQYLSTLAASPSVRACLARKVMSLGLTRRVASTDDLCVSNLIGISNMAPASKFSDLIFNIVSSRQFRQQTTEAQ